MSTGSYLKYLNKIKNYHKTLKIKKYTYVICIICIIFA